MQSTRAFLQRLFPSSFETRVSTPLLSIDPQATGPKVAWKCYTDKSREAFAGIKGQRSSYYAIVPVKADYYDRKRKRM